MSNALPMAFVRPSCAAMRSSAPVTQHWTSVTHTFTRRFCSRSQGSYTNRSSVLSALHSQSQHRPSQRTPNRSFTSTHLVSTQASDAPSNAERVAAGALQAKKRKVPIGPLPNGALNKAMIRRIFGPDMPVGEGNNVLRILHHRRTSGSLVDYGIDNLGARYEGLVDRKKAEKALQWLRDQFPIDEARAAEEWAEKEANRIAYELWLADPDNADSKYNDPARVFKEQQEAENKRRQEEEEDNVQRIGILRAGKSQFEKNFERQRKERLEAAARAAEEKERQEREMQKKLATGEWVKTPGGTQLMKPHQTTYVDVFGREQVSRRKEMLEMYQKKSQTPFKSEEEMLKSTTLTQRLLPMTLFVAFTVAACFLFAHFYVEPAPEYRFWPTLSPSTAAIAAIVAINTLVCLLWRVGPLWPFMTAYFMHVPGYPRAAQAVLNVFSHVQYEHLLSNMMFFGLVGYACHELVGRGVFLGTYLSAGALGSLASLYWCNVGRGNPSVHIVGASAAVWGISALYCLLTDAETIKIPFTQGAEVAFWPKTLLAAFVAMEIRSALKGRTRQSSMDHASHFGGMLTGAAVAGYLRAQGFHAKREGVSEEVKVVDIGAMVKEEVTEVKEGVKKAIKKE